MLDFFLEADERSDHIGLVSAHDERQLALCDFGKVVDRGPLVAVVVLGGGHPAQEQRTQLGNLDGDGSRAAKVACPGASRSGEMSSGVRARETYRRRRGGRQLP